MKSGIKKGGGAAVKTKSQKTIGLSCSSCFGLSSVKGIEAGCKQNSAGGTD